MTPHPIANHLWQSTVFAIAVGMLTLALRKHQARVRYSLWLAASVKFLIPFSLLIAAGSTVQSRPRPVLVAPGALAVGQRLHHPFACSLLPPPPPTPPHTPPIPRFIF